MKKETNPADGSVHMTHTPLGKSSDYIDTYSPQLLCPIPRAQSRQVLDLHKQQLPFYGVDIWNAYEISWLNSKGKPVVAIAQFCVPCDSENIVESKSFKLYLNSFNQTCFDSLEQLKATLIEDISSVAGGQIETNIIPASQWCTLQLASLPGCCLDDLDIRVDNYQPDPSLLSCSSNNETPVQEQLFSHLFRSLCPVTGQPDWASLHINYRGRAIDHAGLLAYLIGFRQHQDFHEQCVERVFSDIMNQCKPTDLTVYANFVRRGGLDICPYRSTSSINIPTLPDVSMASIRLPRQ